MSEVARAAAMAASVAEVARASGLDAAGVSRVSTAYAVAMGPRVERLDDDHHPAYLHPGRSVLILLRDTRLTDPRAFALAALVESRFPELRATAEVVERELGADLARALAEVPAPGDEALAERLVGLEVPVRMAALAERLDHFRHLHLEPRSDAWAACHHECEAVWLPVAERTHPRLGQRYRAWSRAFARKLRNAE